MMGNSFDVCFASPRWSPDTGTKLCSALPAKTPALKGIFSLKISSRKLEASIIRAAIDAKPEVRLKSYR